MNHPLWMFTLICAHGLIFWAGTLQGTLSYETPRWSFLGFLHYLRFWFRPLPPRPSQLPLKHFQIPLWSCQLCQCLWSLFSYLWGPFNCLWGPSSGPWGPLGGLWGPLSCIWSPPRCLRPSQLSRRPTVSNVPYVLSIASEALSNWFGDPFYALSPSFVAVIVPFFVSVFHLSHTVLTMCVCFNTTSKRIELESHTVSQIKDNFEGFPTI